jgi:hypothetical protein
VAVAVAVAAMPRRLVPPLALAALAALVAPRAAAPMARSRAVAAAAPEPELSRVPVATAASS